MTELKQEYDGDFLNRIGCDAMKWADEYMLRFGAELPDKQNLFGWFANAIEFSAVNHRDVIRLRAENERLKAAQGWQQIESAPKNEIIIGGYFNQPRCSAGLESTVVKVWWQEEFNAFISSCRQMTMAPGYLINGKESKLHSPVIEEVTHWKPLDRPPPPQNLAPTQEDG